MVVGGFLMRIGGDRQTAGCTIISDTNDRAPATEIDIVTIIDHEGGRTKFGDAVCAVAKGGYKLFFAKIIA